MYANHSACWDAKNRFGLPDEMPFDYGQIAHLFGECAPVEAVSAPEEKIEPMEPVVLPHIKKDAPADVDTLARLPEEKPKKGKKPADPPERPESMKHDDPEKDQLLSDVWERMAKNAIFDPMVIQAVCAERGYYDAAVPIRDYDMDFIEGCLIEAWDTVLGLALTKQHNLPF